ncbi:putative DNA N6-adenine methyltransferase [Cafeteria roenbergensis virus]|uniref:Putative DNA N6-adenine methyltransferase n=1 Tax=Cafeteria roenbergensis virus (strain BV-PW1) TaxID=693272 RepID=E3T4J4_CROVB|nr:putative DNA N6-adenine methyltransferase [Cafeteria roenbergensis virus BV-PW1]ADO67107.1 putative DNA N6-adenine methyltransferase [Cafeteria roenbergensis virus BV-PW1]
MSKIMMSSTPSIKPTNSTKPKHHLKPKQTTGLNRNTMDKYYTKTNIVKNCIDSIKSNVIINKLDTIIEPSAGNGAFIEEIKHLCNNYKFYDILPENNEIIKQDFLKLDVNNFKNQKIHIIGNPPFGRQSSIAIKFIKKCCLFAESISFILPKSFKKESMRKYFNKYYHLVFEEDLLKNCFLVNNIDCDVPCVFQIWIKKTHPRIETKKQLPINFIFVKKCENPDIAFRRVGVYAGKITQEYDNKSVQSHYFIKFINNKSINVNLKKLNNITFNFNNTVGPKSISKQELIKEFNQVLN